MGKTTSRTAIGIKLNRVNTVSLSGMPWPVTFSTMFSTDPRLPERVQSSPTGLR